MATEPNHENKALASRLTAAADGITNQAAAGLEHDLRTAAAILSDETEPTAPLMSRVISELARIANHTTDPDAQRRIRRLIGEA